jgi:hypothetical protein
VPGSKEHNIIMRIIVRVLTMGKPRTQTSATVRQSYTPLTTIAMATDPMALAKGIMHAIKSILNKDLIIPTPAPMDKINIPLKISVTVIKSEETAMMIVSEVETTAINIMSEVEIDIPITDVTANHIRKNNADLHLIHHTKSALRGITSASTTTMACGRIDIQRTKMGLANGHTSNGIQKSVM